MATKVLVVGATNGRYKDLAKKTTVINSKHGPFGLILCAGDFFNDDQSAIDELISGEVQFPVTTYFITGKTGLPDKIRNALSDTNEVCQNLIYLGKQGTLKTPEGLRIAFLSGVYDQDAYNADVDANDPSTDAYIHKSSFGALLAKMSQVDILLTNPWPTDITKLAETPSTQGPEVSIIQALALRAKPRYFFAGEFNIFYERAPYLDNETRTATRFLSLGHVGNTEKVRWFYAFTLSPNSDAAPPPNITACPFVQARKRQRDGNGFFFSTDGEQKRQRNDKQPPASYVCRICNETGHYIQDCPQKATREKIINPSECWFCLANPKVTKHLIVSIGTEAYLTLPKGQLHVSSPESIPGGGHVLLIPMEHYPTFGRIEPADVRERVLNEIKRYKECLGRIYAEYNYEMVCFEVSRIPRGSGGGHAHIQVVPIPKDLISEAESAFRQEAEYEGLDLVEAEPEEETSYFKVELPDKVLTHTIEPSARFNLQFGRIALANLLGRPERADWKECAVSDKQEKADAKDFKKAFKKYDFTLE